MLTWPPYFSDLANYPQTLIPSSPTQTLLPSPSPSQPSPFPLPPHCSPSPTHTPPPSPFPNADSPFPPSTPPQLPQVPKTRCVNPFRRTSPPSSPLHTSQDTAATQPQANAAASADGFHSSLAGSTDLAVQLKTLLRF
ncbi:protein TRACHEARY ELEMENT DIFFERENTIATION-RELATED 7A-like [Arachis duranensis]|uniref:Protein TRACHEARY ELEMENT DIFFERENTIATION-RELATED 7A-like n=1 Tax=Arachis duranensis TaxID=130453 RepID=A0A9C6THI8_ARADU|nr:protein TRACHEARY ELEMENT DIFFERENTIATION-RELATED 7A-like [Arachis duranensis]